MQTYEHAEAIFERASALQDHLERQDRMLSQGISLVSSRPHPWIEQHRVEPPAQARDQAVGVNGRFAAWITRRMGTMWAFYAAVVFQLTWVGLARRTCSSSTSTRSSSCSSSPAWSSWSSWW